MMRHLLTSSLFPWLIFGTFSFLLCDHLSTVIISLPPASLLLSRFWHADRVGEEATSEHSVPCGSRPCWAAPNPFRDRLFQLSSKQGPHGSQPVHCSGYLPPGRRVIPVNPMFIVSHWWGSAKMSWLSSCAGNTVPVERHQTEGWATGGHLQSVTAIWAGSSFPFILNLLFAEKNEVQAWDTVHNETRSRQLPWQL